MEKRWAFKALLTSSCGNAVKNPQDRIIVRLSASQPTSVQREREGERERGGTLQILEQASKETTPTVNYKKENFKPTVNQTSCRIADQARNETDPSMNDQI